MIRFFKNNQFGGLVGTLLFLTGLALLLWFFSIPSSTEPVHFPIALWIVEGMTSLMGEGSRSEFFIVLAFILLQSTLFGIMAERTQLLYKNTWLPVLFFGFFQLIFPAQLRMNGELLANTFLVLAVLAVFMAQGKERALPALMNAGLCTGIAFLFAPATMLFIPVFLLGILLFKPLRGLDLLQYLLGIVYPVLIAFSVFYFADMDAEIKAYTEGTYFKAGEGQIWSNPYFLGFSIGMGLLFLVIFVRMQQNFFRNTIRVRKFQQFLFFYFLIALLYAMIGAQSIETGIGILALPLSIFLSYYFLPDKRQWLQEVVFFLILFSVFLLHRPLF